MQIFFLQTWHALSVSCKQIATCVKHLLILTLSIVEVVYFETCTAAALSRSKKLQLPIALVQLLTSRMTRVDAI